MYVFLIFFTSNSNVWYHVWQIVVLAGRSMIVRRTYWPQVTSHVMTASLRVTSFKFCLRGNYTKITICQVPFYKQLPQLWRTYLIVRMAVSSKPSDYNANLKRKTFTVRILETRFISILSLFYKNKSISIV